MIIPVKCFTCGKVLGDKYMFYLKAVRKAKLAAGEDDGEDVVYLTKANLQKTVEGKILDKLKLHRICCRRHMLTHVDIE